MDKKEFTQALLQFVEEAQTQKNIVTKEHVEQYFANLGVGKEKLESVYSYLAASGIHIEGEEANSPEHDQNDEKPDVKSKAKQEKNTFFEMYLEDLDAIPEYLPEEENALITHVLAGDKMAKERLIEGNLKYVLQLTKDRCVDTDAFGDLLQEGNMGLMQAVSELSTRKKEQSFRQFAKKYIEDALTGYAQEQVGSERIKKHLVEEVNRLDEAVRTLHEELGREATSKELADCLHLEEEDVVHLIKVSHNAVKANEH